MIGVDEEDVTLRFLCHPKTLRFEQSFLSAIAMSFLIRSNCISEKLTTVFLVMVGFAKLFLSPTRPFAFVHIFVVKTL